MQKNGQRARIRGEDDDLGDSAVESLGSFAKI